MSSAQTAENSQNICVLEPRVCKRHGLKLRPRQRNCDQCNRDANRKYWATLKADAEIGSKLREAMGKSRAYKSVITHLGKNHRDKGLVYFIQADLGDDIKIGWSKNPIKRLKGLQTAAQKELHLLAVMEGDGDLEYAVHQRFAKHRTVGEWFRPAPEILELVRLHATMDGDIRLAV